MHDMRSSLSRFPDHPSRSKLRGIHSKIKNKLPPELEEIRDKYWIFKEEDQREKASRGQSAPLTNETKVRINDYKIRNNKLMLEVEPVKYKDYLVTNHLVANMNEKQIRKIKYEERIDKSKKYAGLSKLIKETYLVDGQFNPRKYLCNADKILLRDNITCSNHLGISSILIGEYEYPKESERDPVLICVPSQSQISSPNEIVPTASGSADWPLLSDAEGYDDILPIDDVRKNPNDLIKINRQIWRELVEECFSDLSGNSMHLGMRHEYLLNWAYEIVKDKYINKCSILNFCQNIERAGHPELFYIMTLKINANEFVKSFFKPNWELYKLWCWPKNRDDLFEDKPINENCELKHSHRLIHFIPSPIDCELELSHNWERSYNYIIKIIENDSYNTILKGHLASILHYCNFKINNK